MTFTLFRDVCSDKNFSSKHPYVAQLAKMASDRCAALVDPLWLIATIE